MAEIKRAGIGAAIFSWWGRPDVEGTADTQGIATDAAVRLAVAAAERAELKFAFHMEPYPKRSIASFRQDVAYLYDCFGASPSWLRSADGRPWYYVYDSYHIEPAAWATALGTQHPSGLRGAREDGYFVALWLGRHGGEEAQRGGFDATYSYFGSDGFSYGSSSRNWPSMVAWSRRAQMPFVASVGPGYNDERIRPWNAANTKPRAGGAYYSAMWRRAIAAGATHVSITSYNEWGEGTQIEPAARSTTITPPALTLPSRAEERRARDAGDVATRAYLDYGEQGPELYLSLTARFAAELGRPAGVAGSASREL
jgi:glycoprotein endo-alpha-1,2-mannosidase